jgi:hypothetical protein
MQEINQKVDVIDDSLDDIKDAIIEKGIIPTGNITTYADAIEALSAISAVDNKSITINATGGGSSEISETASKIQVTMDNGTKDVTITIKSGDPTGGNVGDIWFKY